MKLHTHLMIPLAVSMLCRGGELETELRRGIGDSAESVSTLDLFLDDFGFESVNSVKEFDETPLQLALRTENYTTAAILVDNGAADDILFTLATSRAGLFEIGMGEDEIHGIASVYGNLFIDEVDLNLEGMYSPAIELTFQENTLRVSLLSLSPFLRGMYTESRFCLNGSEQRTE